MAADPTQGPAGMPQGPPAASQAPAGPSNADTAAELRVAICYGAQKAASVNDPNAYREWLQGAFFGAQAVAQVEPPMKPVDPNIHVPPHMNPVDPTAVMKESARAALEAQKQAHDSAMKLIDHRHQAEQAQAQRAHEAAHPELAQQQPPAQPGAQTQPNKPPQDAQRQQQPGGGQGGK